MSLERGSTAALTMGSAGFYRITVCGTLAPEWSARLGGLAISSSNDHQLTVLEGRLLDQAALSGVLNALYNLNLPVYQVAYLGSGEGQPKVPS